MDSNKQNDTGVHLSPDGIAWQNKDISSKYLAEIFGQEFFDIFKGQSFFLCDTSAADPAA